MRKSTPESSPIPGSVAQPPATRDRSEESALLEVKDLNVSFPTADGWATALRDVTLVVRSGETVAVVGESGSGKSVTGLTVMGLLGSGRVDGGSVRFDGTDLVGASASEMRRLRGSRISMIFQDPLAALDPLFTIGAQIEEALRCGGQVGNRRNTRQRVTKLLSEVGIPDPEKRRRAYPHELSGGQRQRVMIAIAMACSPALIIADEPTTALDATVENQILDLIAQMQARTGTALIMITHDMSVVARIADRVVVMYSGQVVESGPVHDVLTHPRHPYTAALVRAVPRFDTDKSRPLPTIEGSVPDLRATVTGCRFHARCPVALERCPVDAPPIFEVGSGTRQSRCWLEHPEVLHEGAAVAESVR